ncbi:ABC transporter substrate-binding protein [Paraburkholderia sp.]|uniref:ABC transporter substrate-binding protein n=1 Tax=Paraburkholderia sp. TaxID=1926495 RepID=UPI002D5193B9|nr:ABC transporter substrate-binding protein [Paraburkholderia sp.]HZZ06252.1 ABC transporter substrate-binding protein [Paraburkholderia sp.]
MKSSLRWMSAAWVATGVSAAWNGHAFADVKIGVTVSTTGPAASLGIPEKNTIALLPKEVAGQKIDYIALNDATDSTQAGKNARKLTSEDHVDALIGSTVVPNLLATIDVAAESTRDMPTSQGIFNMSTNDHAGLDQRARVMVENVGGKWKLSGD